MRLASLLISLTVTLIFSQSAAIASEYEGEIVYPFAEAGEQTLLIDPYLDQSFLDFLESRSVFPVIGDDGFPLFYFSENDEVGCAGICSHVNIGDYVLGSRELEPSSFPALPVLENPLVVGNDGIEDYMNTVNSLRKQFSGNPGALDEIEKALLENQEDYLTSTYYENSYEDVFDFAVNELKKNPEIYRSVVRNIGTGNTGQGVKDLERFIDENFEMDGSFDLSNLYSALDDKRIGGQQLEELLDNMLDRIAEDNNIKMDPHDLEGLSDLLGSDEFRDMAKRAGELIESDPEGFEKMKQLSEDILQSPEARETFRDAIQKMMENADWESVQNLLDLFNKMDNKEQMLESLMQGFSEYMREMAKSGKIDEIKSMLDDQRMLEMVNQATQAFSEGFLEQLSDWAGEIPVEFAYIAALAVTIVTLIVLAKIKI